MKIRCFTFEKMRDYSFLLILLLLIPTGIRAQWKYAQISEDGRIEVTAFDHIQTNNKNIPTHRNASIVLKLSLTFPADPAFKNFRNVTIADINQDGREEIILGVADQLYVFQNERMLWSQKLLGLCRFPVAVGDINQDGLIEIIALTGFNSDPGQVYVFDFAGNIVSPWPVSFNGNWMISSPALADMDGDSTLEIICSDLESSFGQTYILKPDGSSINSQWPIPLPNIPAVTPTVGDLDDDGSLDIIINSTREMYAFNTDGDLIEGWPFSNEGTKFSFQSPIAVDLDRNGSLEVVAEGHGDNPLFLVLNSSGSAYSGWPKAVPGNRWTFHPPTVFDFKGQPHIVMARPISDTPEDMMYLFDQDGSQKSNFPLVKAGGTEGLTSVIDMDNDGSPDLVFPSNILDPEGQGFIHAYNVESGKELDGFPLRMKGFTYLNGATFGDTDGDGLLEMAVLTYTEYPDDQADTSFLHVYDLETPADAGHVWWPTYKGNNLRNGFHTLSSEITSVNDFEVTQTNPFSDHLSVRNNSNREIDAKVYDLNGREMSRRILAPLQQISIKSIHWPKGSYFMTLYDKKSSAFAVRKVLLIR